MKVVVGDWVGNVILDLGLILTGFFSVVRALFLSSVVPKCAGSFWLFLALFGSRAVAMLTVASSAMGCTFIRWVCPIHASRLHAER